MANSTAYLPTETYMGPSSNFTVRVSSAKPKGGYGNYGRVAVIEHEPGYVPAMISDRPRAVKRIVECTGRLYWGSTDDCALARAYEAAKEAAKALAAGKEAA